MADALLSIALQKITDALVSIALQKIGNAGRQQLDMFAAVARDLERLRDGFRSIQALLSDAESMQVANVWLRVWLSRLKHVCYDIDDVLDEWEISGRLEEEEEERDDDEGDGGNKLCACLISCYNSFGRVVFRYNVARRIKEIREWLDQIAVEGRERLDQIAVEGNSFAFSRSRVGCDNGMLVRSPRLTTWHMDESVMIIGREDDKETVISRLVSGSSSNEDRGQVQVVSIVGIGGLGKTRLARQIYNDAKVQDHFTQALYWVRVYEPFDVIGLTKEIIEKVKGERPIKGERPTLSGLNPLQDELFQSLRGKRYLLVLDDVWNDDDEKWELLRLSLISGARGSRILVTTRSHKVANTMNATYIHELKGLSDDQSWTLFSSRAFAGKRLGDGSEFESIGKGIVNNCNGVLLSIKVIGSVMHSKKTVEDWKNVLESKIWSLPQVADKIQPALLLTYFHLPSQLKQCFAYCSMFPKGCELDKDMLVRLWVAQGFIHSETNMEKEDIGDEYFDELAAWSMFQEIEQNYEGKITCKMHDLLHDLAEFIAGDEIYTFISSGSNVRHAFLSFADSDDIPSDIPIAVRRAKKLRTLCLLGIDRSDRVIVDVLRQAKFLRALSFMGSKSTEKTVKLPWIMRHLRCLDFYGSDKMELPSVIVKMRHLRYLDFSGSEIVALPNVIGKMRYLKYLNLSCLNIVELPESVSHLRNLHILDLTGCVKLKRLPRALGKMVSLRYLEIERTDSLECLPKGLGSIGGLQSLCKFIVGGGEGGGCQIDELQRLNSLRGILRIQYLERVSSREEAEKAELWNKSHLRRLVLSMFLRDDADIERTDGVLEGLRPHKNLEELKLFWYTGSNLPIWLEEMPRLHKLELYGCPNLEGLLHRLDSASLRELMIRSCHRIEGISRSSSVSLEKISVIDSCEFFSSGLPHLPNLKAFEIRSSRNKKLPDEGWEQLVALQILEIWNCDELKSLPDGLMHLRSLENLIIYGCDKLERLPEGLGQLKKLKSLTIGVLKALERLPDSLEQLESLEHLDVSSCNKLESLPYGLQQLYLPRLKTFKICSFVNETLPRGGWEQLVALQTLEIRNCSELKSLPDGLAQLQSLENLIIYGCDKLERLPEGLGQLKKLKSLTIGVLKALRFLPDSLKQLESLEHLEVSTCKKLESLPHGLRHLWRLSICGCPLLSERYKREGGVDWLNISHIPIIQIDKQSIH